MYTPEKLTEERRKIAEGNWTRLDYGAALDALEDKQNVCEVLRDVARHRGLEFKKQKERAEKAEANHSLTCAMYKSACDRAEAEAKGRSEAEALFVYSKKEFFDLKEQLENANKRADENYLIAMRNASEGLDHKDRCAELQAIVDACQKRLGPWITKDGKSVKECDDVWHFCTESNCPYGHGHVRSMVVIRGEAAAHWRKPLPVDETYSTKEAALAAQQPQPPKDLGDQKDWKWTNPEGDGK